MKTPLLVLFLLAPLHPAALGSDKSDCPSTTAPLARKATAPVAAKPATAAPNAAASAAQACAPIATPPTEKPKHAPSSRRPAYLFM